jgi:hypothetical protein
MESEHKRGRMVRLVARRYIDPGIAARIQVEGVEPAWTKLTCFVQPGREASLLRHPPLRCLPT